MKDLGDAGRVLSKHTKRDCAQKKLFQGQ